MNWREFVAELVGHLAWPATVVLVVILFRQPLSALIADVSEGEAGPGGLKFKRTWRRTADAATRASTEATPALERGTATPLPDPSREDAEAATDAGPLTIDWADATTMPEAAVLDAYQRLSDRLRELLGVNRLVDAGRTDDISQLARLAHERGLIPLVTVETIDGLEVLRDLARSAPHRVTPAQAQEFQTLTRAVLYALRDSRLMRTATPQPTTNRATQP